MKSRRVCLASGYKYEYEGPTYGIWQRTPDDMWNTVVTKAVCGPLKGHRNIDGARVTVVQAKKKLYAATHATRGLPPNLAKKGTRFV